MAITALQDNAMTALVDGMNAVHTAIRNNAPSGWTVDGNHKVIVHCCEQYGLSTTTGLASSCILCNYIKGNYSSTLCCNLCNWILMCQKVLNRVRYYIACLCMDSACYLGYSNVCCIYACVYCSDTTFTDGSYMCLTDGTCINLCRCRANCVLCDVVRCYTETETYYCPVEYNNSCPSCTYCANQCCDIDFTKMTDAILLNAGLRSLGCGTVCNKCTTGSSGSPIPAPTITGDYTDCAMEKITLSCCSGAYVCYSGETQFCLASYVTFLNYCPLPLYVSCGTLTREVI